MDPCHRFAKPQRLYAAGKPRLLFRSKWRSFFSDSRTSAPWARMCLMRRSQADTLRALFELHSDFRSTGSQRTGRTRVPLLAGIAAGLTTVAAAAESPLSMTVRATEQSSHHSHILVQVENRSDQRFE